MSICHVMLRILRQISHYVILEEADEPKLVFKLVADEDQCMLGFLILSVIIKDLDTATDNRMRFWFSDSLPHQSTIFYDIIAVVSKVISAPFVPILLILL